MYLCLCCCLWDIRCCRATDRQVWGGSLSAVWAWIWKKKTPQASLESCKSVVVVHMCPLMLEHTGTVRALAPFFFPSRHRHESVRMSWCPLDVATTSDKQMNISERLAGESNEVHPDSLVCYSGYCLRKSFRKYPSYQRGWVETTKIGRFGKNRSYVPKRKSLGMVKLPSVVLISLNY